MRSQLASFTPQLTNSAWLIEVETGLGNLTANSKSFYAQLQNRVGFNLLSSAKLLNWNTGDRIKLIIPAEIIKNGEDIWWFVVSAEDTGNIQDAVQIAAIALRLSDQVNSISLPVEFYLSEDAHLETSNLSVATAANLPSSSDQINGQLRYLDDESKWYRYDEEIDIWVEHFFDTANTYLGSTQDIKGADQELGADLIIPPLPINTDSSPITTQPIRYWLIGEETEEDGVTLNGSFNLRIDINGSSVSDTGQVWGNIFAGLFKFQLIGYYRLLTRGIDTGMESVGVTKTWHPQYSLLSLPLNLPAGYAAVYDIWLEGDISNLIDAGDSLEISFDQLGRVGIPSDLAELTGDVVFSKGNQLLVLPNKILDGSAIAGGFYFNAPTESGIFNSAPANTPNQVVILNGATGGTIRTSVAPANLLSSEVVRATFSTEAGYSDPSEFSDVFILTTTDGLSITVSHPVNPNNRASIRANYPDPAIAGSILADWGNPDFRVYVLQGSTLWEEQELRTSESSSTQEIEINSLENFVQVGFIPDASSILGIDFSLFSPGKPSLSALGNGVLPPNSYQVAIRYEYPAPNNLITRIRHDVEGAIKVFPQSFEDLLSTFQRWSNTIISVAEARELDTKLREPLSVWLFSDLGYAPYLLRFDITGVDDGRNIIRFNQGAGGFVPLKTLGLRIGTNTQLFDAYSTVRIGSGLIAEEDIAGRAIAIRLDENAIAPIETRSNLIDAGGNILIDELGNLLVS